MAKGNFLLGTLSSKLGEVVFYRRDGEQIQRARVRQISNPQSAGQANQRLKLPSLTRFYSAFRIPLERSWEGLTKSKSYSAFLRYNLNNVAAPFAVKNTEFFPWNYRVSQGSMVPLPLTANDGSTFEVSLPFDTASVDNIISDSLPADSSGIFAHLMVNYGYQAGDQVTFIGIRKVDGLFIPVWSRFVLITGSPTPLSELLPAGLDVVFDKNADDYIISGLDYAALAIIVSRQATDGRWMRTTSVMTVLPSILETYSGADAQSLAIASYRKTASATLGSDVYLDNANLVSVSTFDGSSFVLNSTTGVVLTPDGVRLRAFVDSNGHFYCIRNEDSDSAVYKKYLLAAKDPTSTVAADWSDSSPSASSYAGVITAVEAAKFV